MSLFDIFWLLFIFSALEPLVRQRALEFSRQRQIAAIEKQRGSRVILLVHRQETMGFLGFPLMRFIDVNDSEEVLRAIELTDPELPIDVILHTPGGLVLASTQIARALKRHRGKVTVMVPHYAMSGGTLIALAADAILMSPCAVLGPVDPQVGTPQGQYPAASVLAAVEKKPLAQVDDTTLILADVAEKAILQLRETVRDLLSATLDHDRAERVADLLTKGAWTHDYPITAEEAVGLGLPVSTQIPADCLQLMRMFPQPVRRAAGVEYTPEARRMKPRS